MSPQCRHTCSRFSISEFHYDSSVTGTVIYECVFHFHFTPNGATEVQNISLNYV